MQVAIDEAQQVLDQARRFHAEHGLTPENARALLESQLSPQDLAQVHADVDAQLQEIERDARFNTPASSPTPAQRLRSRHAMV